MGICVRLLRIFIRRTLLFNGIQVSSIHTPLSHEIYELKDSLGRMFQWLDANSIKVHPVLVIKRASLGPL